MLISIKARKRDTDGMTTGRSSVAGTYEDAVSRARQLIARSVAHNEIVHAAYDPADPYLAEVIESLADYGIRKGHTLEYWGTSEGSETSVGGEWHVHLTTAVQS